MTRAAPKTRTRRSGRPQARGLATRRRVLDAAEALFAQRGYEAASMADVAERAGVSVGTLYHHFPDKRALLLALIDDWGDRELARGRGRIAELREAPEGVRAAVAALLASSSRELSRSGGLRLVLLELAERDPDVRARLARIDQVAVERLAALLAAARARGRIRAAVDPGTAAFLVTRALQAAATEVFVRGTSDPSPLQILAGLEDMICRYLLEDEA
jgi:AcrR family transcriptional regulator